MQELNPYRHMEAGAYVVLVPEPSTWAMMTIGFVGLGFAACRASPKVAAAAAAMA
jgi:hypothetical protein